MFLYKLKLYILLLNSQFCDELTPSEISLPTSFSNRSFIPVATSFSDSCFRPNSLSQLRRLNCSRLLLMTFRSVPSFWASLGNKRTFHISLWRWVIHCHWVERPWGLLYLTVASWQVIWKFLVVVEDRRFAILVVNWSFLVLRRILLVAWHHCGWPTNASAFI